MRRVVTTVGSRPARRGRALAVLLASACLGLRGTTGRADEPTIRQRVEIAARDLPFFDWGDFLYDRLDARSLPRSTPAADRDRYLTVLGGLLDAWRSALRPPGALHPDAAVDEDVASLLASSDARVRTLAMALLFDREDPRWLPLIAARMADDAETFPAPSHFHLVLRPSRPMPPLHLEPVQVRRIAQAMVQFWTGPTTEFPTWWAARKDRAWCIGWFLTRKKRALQQAHPPRAERMVNARRVLGQVERIPVPARDAALLCVFAPSHADDPSGVPEIELVRAGRRLGPPRCLAILRGEPITDDPDEAANHRGPQRFILDHATDLLLPADRSAVLDLARAAPDLLGHWYAAVAHLDPSKASEAIDEGWGRLAGREDLPERSHLAWEGWTILGRPRIPFVVDWLHSLRPTDARYDDLYFLQRLLDRWTPDDRALVAAYVHDARLDTLRGERLVQFVQALERILPEPAVPAALRARVTSFPPDEKDPAVGRALAEWRQAVRESAPRWAPGR